MFPITGLALLIAAPSIAGEVAVSPSVELAFGRTVVERVLADDVTDEDPALPGERVYAYTTISPARSGFVQHVWYRDGKEVARHDLPVGVGRRWRTWSRQQVAAGSYTVEVLSPTGELLLKKSFDVEPFCSQ